MKQKGLIRSHEMEFAFLYRISDLAVIVSFMLLLVFKDMNTAMGERLRHIGFRWRHLFSIYGRKRQSVSLLANQFV